MVDSIGAIAGGVNNTLAANPAKDPTRLGKAAQEFESMLLADLLKTGPKAGTIDGQEESAGADGYDDMSREAVANALASRGGVGIARMLLKQLGPHDENVGEPKSALKLSHTRPMA